VNVLGVSGSLRRDSYNRALLHVAQEVAPPEMEIDLFHLHAIPVFDRDLEAKGDPEPVRQLKTAIRSADALLIATPEYNYGIPGVLKNAIDWASQPARESVLDAKPVAIMGASTGIGGTVEAQAQLRRVLMFPGAQTLPEPEVLVSRARGKFDADGRLTDEGTRAAIAKLLDALVPWTARVEVVAAVAA
jgi:chromate reductase, NAD(P)H dehydrogenase (quinone)